uniref:Transcription termination factor 1 n=1 Tax=Sphenodon punctatus TaxID=8508 RepID=A0A8D0HFA0_SPHPU
MAEESCTYGLEILGPVKIKKGGKEPGKRLKSNQWKHQQSLEAGSPSDHCSLSPLLFEDPASQNTGDHKKKSKKERVKKKKPDFQLDDTCITEESDMNNETVTEVPKLKKKKKKRKRSHSEQEEDSLLSGHGNRGNAGSQQENDTLGDVDYAEIDTPIRKKKKHLANHEVNEASALHALDGNHSKSSKKRKTRDRINSSGAQEIPEENGMLSHVEEQNSNHFSEKKRKVKKLTSTPLSSCLAPPRSHKHGRSANSGVTDENPRGISGDLSKGDDGFCEERVKSCRNNVMISGSHSEQVVLEANNNSPESIVSTREDEEAAASIDFSESESFLLEDNEFLESMMLPAVDLETATKELEEFIPHVRKMSAASIRKMAGRDLIRFKKFRERGIHIRSGKFSAKENKQLRKNVEAFLKETGIGSAEKLLFTYRFPKEKKAINKIKVQNLFGVKIAEGIPRPWRLVYSRARKIFDPQNYKGRYSEEEKTKLKKYHAMYGNNWKKISEMMSRSNLSVALKYSQMKSTVNSGEWSKEETQKLVKAVEEAVMPVLSNQLEGLNAAVQAKDSDGTLLVLRENLYKGISWTQVEGRVETRNWKQCKQKWISILTKRMSSGQKIFHGTKGLQNRIILIKRMYELKVEDANEVNWEEVADVIGDVPADYLQARFYRLKASYVPFWHTKSFPEILDHLYENTLPLLTKRLEKRNEKVRNSSPQTEIFQFSDIFYDSEDDSSKCERNDVS